MEKLIEKVQELEKNFNVEEQIKILQEIGALLLTDYEVRIGDEIIHPLRVEAYYWPYRTKNKFDDNTTFPSSDKLGKFGKLYFIETKHGYPGIDICLSRDDYYLSFLIKNSYIGNVLYKQLDLYERFKDRKEELKDKVVLFAAPHKNETVFHTVRVMNSVKNLEAKPFAKKCLASLLDINRKNENGKSVFNWARGYGKQWTVAVYALSNIDDETSARELARDLNGSNIEEKYWTSAKESLGIL